MEIPAFNKLKGGDPIDVETPSGPVKFWVLNGMRGEGTEKWKLSITGYLNNPIEANVECRIGFNGKESSGQFLGREKEGKFWKCTFQTFIKDPTFWGDAQLEN